MKKVISILILFWSINLIAQKDYSSQWEDLFSYNEIIDFVIQTDIIYAVTENAMFIYNLKNQEIQKKSSINGLSGAKTSTVFFDENSESVFIGYENGLIDILDTNQDVYPVTGINQNIILVNKKVNGFYNDGDKTYVYGSFGILEFDIENKEFGDSYKLSNSESPLEVNAVSVYNDNLYAATIDGLYSINVSKTSQVSPNKFSNWTQISTGNITGLLMVDTALYFYKENVVRNINSPNDNSISFPETIINLDKTDTVNQITVSSSKRIKIYTINDFNALTELDFSQSLSHTFTASKTLYDKNNFYVATTTNGILSTKISDNNLYTEIHPEGPSRNDTFSITARKGDLWISYGSYNNIYNFGGKTVGISGFYNNQWYSIPYSEFNARDIIKIEVNPFDSSKIYLASYFNGVNVLSFDEKSKLWKTTDKWTDKTTDNGLAGSGATSEPIIPYLIIDNNDKLWVPNTYAKENKNFSSYNFKSETWEALIDYSSYANRLDVRMNNMYVHNDGNIFAGTSANGLYVFKETYDQNLSIDNSDNKITAINELSDSGNLPSKMVRAVVVDNNDKVWIGTDIGLLVFDDYENLYSKTKGAASKIIIEESGVPSELLGNTKINDIIIDKAGSKWIATDGAGIFNVSSDGQTTFNIFNITNSPLLSDNVIDLELDEDTGSIYMVTDKGVLVYTNNSEPFGTSITSVIAYPNPAIRNQVGHEKITIVAKDGNGIPDGTNVKIMDVSGRLVFETNVSDSGDSQGGRIVWNKKNLRGNSVASGIYIVLLSNADGTENTTTKIAIVN
ncbi:ligand-binding sensor domain-containing protein [Wenyingzhuangia heitensis]|uniref:Ligand-binding sensor domain-containing protein n=1 Tax=Wenyingzhuangia heitensis TaxID=1487859 RepID=A0ABX0U6S7_9FLAO|nr:hypothetical protein [Wenyingzhuangia heitensis]NIJ43878.1 ligand-binding sensor domain-containing protein [Wenyingzhuangia heitensis]